MNRKAPRTRPALSTLAALAIGLGLAAPAPARAQSPRIPDVNQRSGLLGRFAPTMRTNLPQDGDRDNFYGTRYGDFYVPPGTNSPFNGGMYGQRLDPGCTSCSSPYFYGTPGGTGRACPGCRPHYKTQLGRTAQNLVHPFRPVGHYYQNGCYVPIYDLDPIVPGPGYDLWPFFHNGHRGG